MIPIRLLHIINLVLIIVLAFLAYGIFESYWHPAEKRGLQVVEEAEELVSIAKPKMTYGRYRVIEQANIFKCKDILPTPPPEPTPMPTPAPPLPPLQLEFKGATTSPISGYVKAIIYNRKNRRSDFYSVNDTVPDTGGAKIIEIKRNKVVLERQGREETLELYPEDK